VFVPGPDRDSVTVMHSLHGSRFVVSADMLSRILRGERPRVLGKSARALTSAMDELVREQILVDDASFDRIVRELGNSLAPCERAVLRGFNDGGAKATPSGMPPPVMKPARPGRPLPASRTSADLRTLTTWLASRESVRTYGKRPINRAELERFLATTARAYAHVQVPGLGTTSLRNYPSGGARYPLEIYPVVLNVRSLAAGLYHYHPFHHRLEFLGRESRVIAALRHVVREKMGRPSADSTEPAVLFVITAVFSRTCWKYEGIPLQLVLQETGALYQTMYMAAAVMRLAGCAVGAFPERAMSEVLALGDDEGQVGLFVLGARRAASGGRREIVDRVTFRRGSPFSPDAERTSVELVLRGGQVETIDERDFKITRTGSTLSCLVMRGRRRAVLVGTARAEVIKRLRLGRR